MGVSHNCARLKSDGVLAIGGLSVRDLPENIFFVVQNETTPSICFPATACPLKKWQCKASTVLRTNTHVKMQTLGSKRRQAEGKPRQETTLHTW